MTFLDEFENYVTYLFKDFDYSANDQSYVMWY